MKEIRDIGAFTGRYGGYWRDDVLDFCYLANPYFPPREFLRLLTRTFPRAVKFYPSTHKVVARFLGRYLGLDPDTLFVGNGGSECINVLNRSLSGSLLLPVPAFNEYENNRLNAGLRVRHFVLEEKAGFRIDPEKFVRAARSADAAVIISPNNPTGLALDKDELVSVCRGTRRLDRLVVDESFINFSYRDRKADPTMLGSLGRFPHLAVLASMSKDYGVPGLRIGYIASADREFIAKLRRNNPIWNINCLSEIFLERLPEFRAEFDRSRIAVVETTRELSDGLSRIPFLRPAPTSANFVFCEVLKPFSSTSLTRLLLGKHGIYINDCSNKPGMNRRFVRIASRDRRDNAVLLKTLRHLGS
jgi:histidinol-phosphate/aromatic aminotransferase/cobyric acid decarboxylase-like protein